MRNTYLKFAILLPFVLLGACTSQAQQKTWLKNFQLGNVSYKLYSIEGGNSKGLNDTSYYVLYRAAKVKPITKEIKEIKNKKTGKILFSSAFQVVGKEILFGRADDSLYHKYKRFTQNADGSFRASKDEVLKAERGAAHTIAEPVIEKKISGDQVDVLAEFPGGINAARNFIAQNVIFPDEALENDVQGSVYVSFVIEKDGSVSNIQIEKGLGYGCDEEVIRVLKKLPKWKPAELRGEKVRSKMRMPISFRSQ